MPDGRWEQTLRDQGHRWIAGVDEVGRGPLAGPVVAAAVIVDAGTVPPELLQSLDDSKKLTAKRRQILAEQIRTHCPCALGWASVEEIDAVNILQATFLAMRRALNGLEPTVTAALIDGNQVPPDLPCAVQTVVGGDGQSWSIAAASILAKVTRDAYMTDLAKEFPVYGWERNAGYGTASHRRALQKYGPTDHHRRSFAPVAAFFAGGTTA